MARPMPPAPPVTTHTLSVGSSTHVPVTVMPHPRRQQCTCLDYHAARMSWPAGFPGPARRRQAAQTYQTITIALMIRAPAPVDTSPRNSMRRDRCCSVTPTSSPPRPETTPGRAHQARADHRAAAQPPRASTRRPRFTFIASLRGIASTISSDFGTLYADQACLAYALTSSNVGGSAGLSAR